MLSLKPRDFMPARETAAPANAPRLDAGEAPRAGAAR